MQVFVSHSSRDKLFARKLRDELTSRGIRVWLDEAEIRVGQSIPDEIGRAIDASDVFCIVLSASSIASPWVARELNSYMPRMIARAGVILPCHLDQVPTFPLIADLKYADFSLSFEAGISSLLAAVGIKEELDRVTLVEQTTSAVARILTGAELAFFVHRFSVSDHFLIADSGETPAPWGVLHKLRDLGILNEDADRYEFLFSLTDLGCAVLAAASALVPEDLLIALDSGEQSRPKTR